MKTHEIKAGMVVTAKGHTFDICYDGERNRLFAWNRSNREETDPVQHYASFVAAQERSWIDDDVSGSLELVDTIAEVSHPACPAATAKALQQIEAASLAGGLEVHRALWKQARVYGVENLVQAINSIGALMSMLGIDPEMCQAIVGYAIGFKHSDDFKLDRAVAECSANVTAGFHLGAVLRDEANKDPSKN